MDLRSDNLNKEFFAVPGRIGGKAHFGIPGTGEVNEFLDYIEDMSILLGCPDCRSFNVREIEISGMKVHVCSDCGRTDHVQPAN